MTIQQRILKRIWRRNRRGEGCKRWSMNPLERQFLEGLLMNGEIVRTVFGEMWISIEPDNRGYPRYKNWLSQAEIDREYIKRDKRREQIFMLELYATTVAPIMLILAFCAVVLYLEAVNN